MLEKGMKNSLQNTIFCVISDMGSELTGQFYMHFFKKEIQFLEEITIAIWFIKLNNYKIKGTHGCKANHLLDLLINFLQKKSDK